MRKRRRADRCLRGRTVRRHDLRNNADRVRKFLFCRDQAFKRFARQVPMTDLTPSRTAEIADFADRKRREVVVEHETALALRLHGFDKLFGARSSQGRYGQSLRVAAAEKRRTMRSRKKPTSASNARNSSSFRPSGRRSFSKTFLWTS